MENWIYVVAVFGVFVGLIVWCRLDTHGHIFLKDQGH